MSWTELGLLCTSEFDLMVEFFYEILFCTRIFCLHSQNSFHNRGRCNVLKTSTKQCQINENVNKIISNR